MYLDRNTWVNTTLLASDDSGEDSSEDHNSKPAVHFDGLQWHVILGICLVSIGLFLILLCVTWSCIRKHCGASVPTKIGRIKVIVRQPSVASLGDDISNQRTWVSTTSMSNLEENHPSIFQVLPSLQNPRSKDHSIDQKDNPPSYEASMDKRKKLEQKFLNV